MESTIRETSGIRREIDLTLSKGELDPYINNAYRTAQQKVQIKGFRPGKTPIALIKKMYGPSLENEAVENAVQQEFSKHATEKKIQPIGTPAITKLERNDDGGLDITIAYEVFPEFTLGSYKGLSAQRIIHRVSDQELSQEMDRLRERSMSTEPADTVADENHVVSIDLQKLDAEGSPVEGDTMNDLKLNLHRPDVSPDLKAGVLGKKVGDTFPVDLPTGENESMVSYDVTVRDIQRITLPELDDTFAATITGNPDATIEQLTEMVQREIEAAYDGRYSRMFRDELIGQLLESHQFEVPEVFVHEALNSFVEDMKKGPNKELPADFNRAEFDKEMHPVAVRTVKWAILRERIIDQEELKAEEVDYEGLADMEAQRTGYDYDMLLKYLKASASTRDRILSEKAVQLLEDYAIVQEIDDTEMIAAHAREHSHEGHSHEGHSHEGHSHEGHSHDEGELGEDSDETVASESEEGR